MINVLVVDDSAYNRVTISRLLETHGDVRVIATAINGEDAIKQVVRHKPDVVTLDLEMPVMDGFAFLRWVMANSPVPVIAVSSKSSDRSVFKALELGAVDFVPKPGGRVSPRLREIEEDLVRKVLHVVTARLDNLQRRVKQDEEEPKPVPLSEACAAGIELIAVGSSTGGPPALQFIFESLPRLPVPFVVAQHMPPNFTRLFAERVNKLSKLDVREAVDGDALEPANVYIAPGGRMLEIERRDGRLLARVADPQPDELHAPSVDRLFASASDACGDRLIAIVLTGMGDDGAKAIRKVRERGARTIAESQDTAIIFGMPSEAIKTGCVESVLALGDIPTAIARMCIGS